jgi:chemotaxis protein methyltransferase CheR
MTTAALPATGLHSLSEGDFQTIQRFLSQHSGIELTAEKHYLVKSRLTAVVNRFQMQSFSELADALRTSSLSHHAVRSAVIDAMTTNETSWFRDENQFNALKHQLLPGLAASKASPLRLWSAACSSGQEPYSLSICALESLATQRLAASVNIIGTDISEAILQDAENAVYSEMALSRGIDSATRERYFTSHANGYQLKPSVRQTVRFQQLNLLKPFSGLGRFDIIFCRNVLIYFSDAVKRDIINRMADNLNPNGYLFLSSTETIPSEGSRFKTIHSHGTSYYQLAQR